MTASVIASYAILKVNWEQPERKDYLDNFMLIVAEAIRQLQNDIITLSDVQKQIRTSFGFEIPQNTISSLLNRVKRHGYISLENGIYTRDNAALMKLNFQSIQQQVSLSHESLIRGLTEFVKKNYSLDWSLDYGEKALQAYLEEHQVKLLSELQAERSGNNHSVLPDAKRQLQYVIAKFIENLLDTRSPQIDYLLVSCVLG